MGKSKNCLLMFRIPATAKGYELVTQMRNMLNKDSYKMRTLFTGKRPKNHTAYTLKKDAESIRVYIESILEDGTNPRINDIYENGITTGKAREHFANEELISELKNKLDAKENELKLEITHHAMMREERDKLNKTLSAKDTVISNYQNDMDLRQREIDRLNTKVDNEVCEGSCVSQEDYNSILTEIIALNKSLAKAHGNIITYKKLLEEELTKNDALTECHSKLEENINVQNRSVSRTSDDVDLDKLIDMDFAEWVERQSWHKRWLYKIGSVSWRDFAFIMLAFWTIPMIVLLTLKVEGVIN